MTLAEDGVITSYSIHYTKLYDISLQWTDLPVTYYVTNRDVPGVTASQLQSTIERAFDTWTGTDGIRLSSRFGGYTAAEPFEDDFTTVIGFRITSYNVCYTKLLRDRG